jgi:hypothetical protein
MQSIRSTLWLLLVTLLVFVPVAVAQPASHSLTPDNRQANCGRIPCTPTPNIPFDDRDGDGIAGFVDSCPDMFAPGTGNGCTGGIVPPVTQPTNLPGVNFPPNEWCLLGASVGVNVRNIASVLGQVIYVLPAGQTIETYQKVQNSLGETWYTVSHPQTFAPGYIRADAVINNGNCGEDKVPLRFIWESLNVCMVAVGLTSITNGMVYQAPDYSSPVIGEILPGENYNAISLGYDLNGNLFFEIPEKGGWVASGTVENNGLCIDLPVTIGQPDDMDICFTAANAPLPVYSAPTTVAPVIFTLPVGEALWVRELVTNSDGEQWYGVTFNTHFEPWDYTLPNGFVQPNTPVTSDCDTLPQYFYYTDNYNEDSNGQCLLTMLVNVTVYSQPDPSSPVVEILGAGQTFPPGFTHMVNGEKWWGASIASDEGGQGWIKDDAAQVTANEFCTDLPQGVPTNPPDGIEVPTIPGWNNIPDDDGIDENDLPEGGIIIIDPNDLAGVPSLQHTPEAIPTPPLLPIDWYFIDPRFGPLWERTSIAFSGLDGVDDSPRQLDAFLLLPAIGDRPDQCPRDQFDALFNLTDPELPSSLLPTVQQIRDEVAPIRYTPSAMMGDGSVRPSSYLPEGSLDCALLLAIPGDGSVRWYAFFDGFEGFTGGVFDG